VTESLSRLPDCDDFRVRRRIMVNLTAIMTFANRLTLINRNRPDRRVPMRQSKPRFIQCNAHPDFVV
jgi:hypothetical protein